MKDTNKTYINKKRSYQKPEIEQIQLDNEISMVMVSPPGDPALIESDNQFDSNPFKMLKF